MYRRLLIPVSEPPEVEPLIRFGAALLDADGEIRMLHIIPTTTLPEMTRRWRASVNLVVPAHEAGAALDVRVDPEVRAAVNVSGEILEMAESHSVDGILMTLRGSKQSRNPFVGHTASAVLHHASCDVIVVNRLALIEEKIPRILIPSLTPNPSPKAMQLAEEIAVRHHGVPIVTLSISTREEGRQSPPEPPGRSPRGLPLSHRRSVFSQAFLGRRRRLPELILQQAARERFGLLLVGDDVTHSEGPLLTRRFLEELFRAAPCPVMAVRG
jgi:nucleotide-binding universal stress UspA family protein